MRLFRYDLKQITYDYTLEVTNRFKGLDQGDRIPEELQTEVCNIVQEAVTKTIQRKRNTRKQSSCLRKLYEQLRKEENRKTKVKGNILCKEGYDNGQKW